MNKREPLVGGSLLFKLGFFLRLSFQCLYLVETKSLGGVLLFHEFICKCFRLIRFSKERNMK